SGGRAHVVFHPRHTGRDRVCRNEGQTDPDATIGSGQHVGANERARRKGETESELRSGRIGESRRWSVPKSDWYRRRDRSRARQAARLGHHFWSRHSGGTGILAGRARIIGIPSEVSRDGGIISK